MQPTSFTVIRDLVYNYIDNANQIVDNGRYSSRFSSLFTSLFQYFQITENEINTDILFATVPDLYNLLKVKETVTLKENIEIRGIYWCLDMRSILRSQLIQSKDRLAHFREIEQIFTTHLQGFLL